jgi:DNA polymerase III sliding clamp (beta) subunit (PCNA family)
MIKKLLILLHKKILGLYFNGLYVISNKKIIIVGTDGRRLTKIEREINNHLPFEKGVIIPHKAIKEILELLIQMIQEVLH